MINLSRSLEDDLALDDEESQYFDHNLCHYEVTYSSYGMGCLDPTSTKPAKIKTLIQGYPVLRNTDEVMLDMKRLVCKTNDGDLTKKARDFLSKSFMFGLANSKIKVPKTYDDRDTSIAHALFNTQRIFPMDKSVGNKAVFVIGNAEEDD